MDSISGSDIGRIPIPSARRSIHSIRASSVVESSIMGRYGADEVDNVMSKHSSPISSNTIRSHRSFDRRNSLNDEDRNCSADNINMLSKSVPATLPSHTLYSDYTDDEQEANIQNAATEALLNHTSPGSNRSRSASNISLHQSDDSFSSQKYSQAKPNHMKNIVIILSLAVLIISIYTIKFNANESENLIKYDNYKFHKDINELGQKYNIGENALIKVKSGISTIYQRKDTGSFMFVYNTNANNFNSNKFNKFMDDISDAAAHYLRNNTTSVRYTKVEGYDLDMKDHSELIYKFRNDLEHNGVMLVTHIEAIPSTLAMAFHYYCDEYNPLVTKSAIFFTLNLAKCSSETVISTTHATIEKCLSKKWNGVHEDSIGPLLTRVVNVVIDVTEVFTGK